MDEMEKDLKMKYRLVKKFVSEKGLNGAEKTALDELCEFSQNYGDVGMDDFKAFLSDVSGYSFDIVVYPLYNEPHFYFQFIQDYPCGIEGFYKRIGSVPSDYLKYDEEDFLFLSEDNQKVLCNVMFTELADELLKWIETEGK